MKLYLDRGVFHELKDIEMFKTARVYFSSVAWANDADFDPEALYDLGLPLKDCHSGTQRRITACMKELGWKKKRWRDASGRRVRGYQKG